MGRAADVWEHKSHAQSQREDIVEQERDKSTDELDDAIASADDTGMVGQQQEIAEEEILLNTMPPAEEKPEDES